MRQPLLHIYYLGLLVYVISSCENLFLIFLSPCGRGFKPAPECFYQGVRGISSVFLEVTCSYIAFTTVRKYCNYNSLTYLFCQHKCTLHSKIGRASCRER